MSKRGFAPEGEWTSERGTEWSENQRPGSPLLRGDRGRENLHSYQSNSILVGLAYAGPRSCWHCDFLAVCPAKGGSCQWILPDRRGSQLYGGSELPRIRRQGNDSVCVQGDGCL